jgi:glucose-1-phosphate cytidylyltransferase
MKSFILCGGRGTRLDLESKDKPKAMVKIGKYPIIIHLIKIFLKNGISEFVLCLGYKKEVIEKYFTETFNKKKYAFNFEINQKKVKKIGFLLNKKKVTIYLVDTKMNSGTAGRIKIANSVIKNTDTFLMTYCDGLANINIKKLINEHKKSKKLVTVTAVQPRHRYGVLEIKKKLVTKLNNNNPKQNIRINAGFFVIEQKALKFIKNELNYWELESIKKIIRIKQLNSFIFDGFWSSLDTLKDKLYLNNLWKKNKKIW